VERRGEDLAVARELSVAGHLLEQDVELVVGLQIVVEVDLAAEDFRERHRELHVRPPRPPRR
jgi:hypothetical protein